VLITSGQITPQPLYSRQKDEGREAVAEDLSHAIFNRLTDRRKTWKTD
jgi:hypothetical protein